MKWRNAEPAKPCVFEAHQNGVDREIDKYDCKGWYKRHMPKEKNKIRSTRH